MKSYAPLLREAAFPTGLGLVVGTRGPGGLRLPARGQQMVQGTPQPQLGESRGSGTRPSLVPPLLLPWLC